MLLNVKLYVPFVLIVWLEGPPLFPVAVCPIGSLLIQTTVSPFLTVREAGLKAKFRIVTLWVTGFDAGNETGVGFGIGVGAGDGGFVVPYEGVLFALF